MPPEHVENVLEGDIADQLISHLSSSSRTFRGGNGRTFRLAYLEETPGDEDLLAVIDPTTGDIYEIEIEVFVRQIHAPKELKVN